MMFLFPGQGSQQPGMGKFLFENFQIAKEIFEEASDALQINMKKLCFEGSEQDLALTSNTQPCLLLVSTATQKVLTTQFAAKPSQAAGHSIGEYAALVAADVMPFAQAMRSVRSRGEAMQSAVPVGQGGMVAVMGLENEQVEKMCAIAQEKSKMGPLSPANFNCPGQVVISGSQKTIDWLKINFKPEEFFPEAAENLRRVKMIPLQVSAPFHCALMKPAEDKMREVLGEIPFANAKFPIVQNYTAKPHVLAAELKENLIRQVSAPVRWTQSMQFVREKTPRNAEGISITTVFECGVGKVLGGLLKKIDSEGFRVFNTNNLEDLENIEKFIKNSQQHGA